MMAMQLDGLVIFSTEQYGFNKEQVARHLVEIHQEYEKLRNENIRLKKKMKDIKEKAENIR